MNIKQTLQVKNGQVVAIEAIDKTKEEKSKTFFTFSAILALFAFISLACGLHPVYAVVAGVSALFLSGFGFANMEANGELA